MALRNNNFGIFSATGGGSGGGACVTSIGISVCQQSGLCLTYTSNPITNSGTFSISNLCPYFGNSVHVLDSGTCSTIRCGVNNSASGSYSASLGGCCNVVSSSYSSIVGGCGNTIKTNNQSFIGSGQSNTLCASNSVILGGTNNNIYCVSSFDYTFGSIGGGDCNIMCSGAVDTTPYSFIGGGKCNTQSQTGAFVIRPGVIMGGFCNNNITNHSIGGGTKNITSGGLESTILGGALNSIETSCATIIGGSCNSVLGGGAYGSIGGGFKSTISTNGDISTILGGYQNDTDGCDATIGGGCSNNSMCRNVAIVGGEYNYGNGISSFIGGGLGNVICETTSGISSGVMNSIANATTYGVFSISPTLINLYNNVSPQFSVNDVVYYYDTTNVQVYQATITSVTYNSGSGYTELGGSFSGTSVTYLKNLTKTTSNSSCFSLIDEGYANTSSASYTSILNGVTNVVNNNFSNIFNGNTNATCNGGTSCHNQIDNGKLNLILSDNSCFNTILNGCNNQINSNCFQYGLITNGLNNCVTSSIGGGFQVVGGCGNLGVGYASFIGSGILNTIYDASNNPTCNISSVIVGGVGNNTFGGSWSGTYFTAPPTLVSAGKYSFIGGGIQNITKCTYGVVFGGQENKNCGCLSMIGGGVYNEISDNGGECVNAFSTIFGGQSNKVCPDGGGCSIIGGGNTNTICSNRSVIIGGQNNQILDNTTYGYNFIGGGSNNYTIGCYNNIFGGDSNNINGEIFSTIFGGKNNTINNNISSILGGTTNQIDGNNCGGIIGSNNELSGNTLGGTNSFIIGNSIVKNNGESNTTFVNSLSIVNTPNCCQIGLTLGRDATTGNIITIPTSSFQSVGLCVPQGLCVYSTNPLTSGGNLCVCGGGLSSQYITGLGTLANFPSETGGGGAVYYFNGGINQGTFGGNTYYQLSTCANVGSQVSFPKTNDGVIARFITDANQPNLTYVPSGLWNIFAYFNSNSTSTNVAANLYVYNGSTFTQIGVGTIEQIANAAVVDLYDFGISVTGTNISSTDRLAIEFVASSNNTRTVTLYTQNDTISSVTTTLPSGLGSLNGLINSSQTFATCTNGTNFAITSANGVHCWSLPTASATNRGALSSSDWNSFNADIGCSLPAYSFQANCNASCGAYSNLCYFESSELTNTSVITYTTTGTPPSGTCLTTYRYTRYGNNVSAQFSGCYSVAGNLVSALSFFLPSTFPCAVSVGAITAASSPLFWGSGGFLCATNSLFPTPGGTFYMGRVTLRCCVSTDIANCQNRNILIQQQGNNQCVCAWWATINYITS